MPLTLSENIINRIPQDFFNLFNNIIQVKDVAPRWPSIITATTDDTISDVFKSLIDNRIQCVPLLNVKTNRYEAFIDIFDILSYIIEVLDLSINSDDSWMISKQLQNELCVVLPNRSKRDPWQIIQEDSPISLAINKLSISGIHRLAVFDSSGQFTSILTQSRVARYISNRSLELGEFGRIEIRNLPIISKNLKTINENERLINAFLTIYSHNVTGIAVVDEENKIVGNISLSDFKDIGFRVDQFPKLFIPISTYLKKKNEGRNVPKLVWAKDTTSLNDLLTQFRIDGVHRIYITEERGDPIGVVTMTDVMVLFASVLGSQEYDR